MGKIRVLFLLQHRESCNSENKSNYKKMALGLVEALSDEKRPLLRG